MSSNSGPYRLANGGEIDRTRRISFRFDKRTYFGHPGDTLASALLANGVRVVARSFKFHRPRGIFSCGLEESNALVQVDEGAGMVPSCRAPVVELHEGLVAQSQKGWPSVNFDIARVLDFTALLWSAGFYNKTFIWPNWHTYEGLIRHLAGLGHAPRERSPHRYEVVNHHCDVLVVGGGRAGLCAALDSARAGARVVLADQDRELGGQATWDGSRVGESPAKTWVQETASELAQLRVRLFTRTAAVGCYDHNVVALAERTESNGSCGGRERLHIVRTHRIVLAAGTIEQPLIFANNDRPGIFLAGAARQYLKRYGVAVGRRVLIATNNDSAYALAAELRGAGVAVVLVDCRSEQAIPELLPPRLRDRGIELLLCSLPVDTCGFGQLKSVTVGRLSADQQSIEAQQTFRCDALAVSGGFGPALHLYAQAGGKLQFDAASGTLQPIARALETSTQARSIEIIGSARQVVAAGPRVSPNGNPRRQWVDLAHDVTVSDLKLALHESYSNIEHVKRYTTVGMAADQGKTSHAAALEVVGKLRGVSPRDLGHTTFRPPVTPVTLGAIVGRETGPLFSPHRRLPMHDWHLANGALMHDYGEWRRPTCYLRGGESREGAVQHEALAVRTGVGLFDGSSLGKIEIHGPDALTFLDRFYINDLTTLKPFRVRYGLMLRESGILFDDGTVVQLAPDRFLITTTSGNATRVGQWLEEWHQCEWPNLRVAILPVTDCWATLSLTGPKARVMLARLESNLAFANEAFPHLSMREGTLLGNPARIYRVSFSGELTYEINVPSDHGSRLWKALLEAGRAEGIQPFGLDALMLMRLEKGFLHLGSDTDGTTIPDDVGFGKVAANKKADFIGKRSLQLAEHLRADRLQLVGLAAPKGQPFVIGSHLRIKNSREATDGWITSAGIGVLTDSPVALALVRGGRARIGESVDLYDAGTSIGEAQIVNPPFYDPPGERMNG
jgi:sarcosine oxidase subunit alpha